MSTNAAEAGFRIAFSGEEAAPEAEAIAQALRAAGHDPGLTDHLRPAGGTLGAAEVVLTIAAAAAAKSAIDVGLRTLESYLLAHVSRPKNRSIGFQVVIQKPQAPVKRLGLDLKSLTSDLVKSFMDELRQQLRTLV